MKPTPKPARVWLTVPGEALDCVHLDACRRLSEQSGVRWPRCEGCTHRQEAKQ